MVSGFIAPIIPNNYAILSPMKFIRFQVNDDKPQAAAARVSLAARAAALGLAVKTEGAVDAVVALGGDGTFLRAVHECPEVPVLGLNLGGLGYLASVEERGFTSALEKLATGRYQISERRMIEVDGRFAAVLPVGKRGGQQRHYHAQRRKKAYNFSLQLHILLYSSPSDGRA